MSDTEMQTKSFPSPYELKAPAGSEGWESLYPYNLVFREELREQEEGRFWFCDSQHWPNVFKPFEVTMVEFASRNLGAYNTRHYLVPPANGIDYRIHNGYNYFSPVPVPPEQIAARVPHFLERAGYYFQNWESLLENWHTKVTDNIKAIEAIEFTPLPEMVPMETITEGVGYDPSVDLFEAYDKLLALAYRNWEHHMEFLNLGYVAYLDLFQFCKEAFPGIPDLAIAKMVAGVDSVLFRPDDELKKLSTLAVELGLQDAFTRGDGNAEATLTALREAPRGQEWIQAWEAAQDPWFNYTSGNGFYGDDKYWRDDLDIPMGYIRDYVVRVAAGETLGRPKDELIAERDRIAEEYASVLDDEARATFEGKLGLARTVYPYVEDHNFYIEHWTMGVFWRKVRQLSNMLHEQGFWPQPNDILYLSRDEVRPVLFDYASAWAVGTEPIGPTYWPKEIERRRAIITALEQERPQPAFNTPPAQISEPFTVMLWGITTEQVQQWLGSDDAEEGVLSGMAASGGVVEGPARVITNASQLGELQQGEILVAPVTAPSWGPVFGKIAATVTDIGGMMSHAAIVCREYGVPAVTGTGKASTTITTGMRLRVDGNQGKVTILD
ncbi:PEP-utilizing enzyme [Microbacterium sp. 67-17]|uniref:PEP-utilizing enzyme n=1 Tax=Microbacterium sp. 67-17 TaxID=1895782 RepID=UPI000AC082BE|nr:PEP-utilizing enzyme [Microbacterium sp. 67-17]